MITNTNNNMQENIITNESATQSARVATCDAPSNTNPATEQTSPRNPSVSEWDEVLEETPVPKISNALQTISMTDLYDTTYPPRTALIENFIFPGTHLFVGAPKLGKSFMMAQIAYHISVGKNMWGLETSPATVLYLALEDDYSRLQGRLSKMFGMEISENLHFSTMSGKVGDRLEVQLKSFIKKHPETRLIIIDTLQKIRENSTDNRGYASDYEFISRLKKFTDATGLCILVVHHTRKQKAGDPFEMISGSNGLLGAADGAFLLCKAKHLDDFAFLHITGRDQPDQTMHMRFDRERYLWELIGYENDLQDEEVVPDPLLELVSLFVGGENGDWSGNASTLHEIIGDSDYQPNTLVRKLNISVDRLYHEYGIAYENKRTRFGSLIRLSKVG